MSFANDRSGRSSRLGTDEPDPMPAAAGYPLSIIALALAIIGVILSSILFARPPVASPPPATVSATYLLNFSSGCQEPLSWPMQVVQVGSLVCLEIPAFLCPSDGSVGGLIADMPLNVPSPGSFLSVAKVPLVEIPLTVNDVFLTPGSASINWNQSFSQSPPIFLIQCGPNPTLPCGPIPGAHIGPSADITLCYISGNPVVPP